mmetsp:Transcript_27504/g.40459  ORF Transcript_27504/g.40459 Transcript_27504/m.40459 type:complete len:127 (-) Transcript_27504:2488-2868(-)
MEEDNTAVALSPPTSIVSETIPELEGKTAALIVSLRSTPTQEQGASTNDTFKKIFSKGKILPLYVSLRCKHIFLSLTLFLSLSLVLQHYKCTTAQQSNVICISHYSHKCVSTMICTTGTKWRDTVN